jgi:NAD(P)-dependent dehydrogenase (short-subunit alcohol dehydrogenase family)
MNGKKVALVTGSTSGIGLGIARLLAARGYFVVVHSRSSVEAGRGLAAELDGSYVQADLSKDEDRCRLVRAAAESTGRLDVLVNNAGISQVIPHGNLRAATPEIWHDLYEVNVIAPFRLVAEAEPYLRAAAKAGSSAAVVNIASHAGVRPKGASIPYSASKAALAHTTKLLAVSLAPEIRVNAVAPGLVDTPLTATWADARALWRERAPMRRAATPEDIAKCVLALVEADYVTGEVILADGGLNLT